MKIKCLLKESLDINKYYINIYDLNNNLVYKGYSEYNCFNIDIKKGIYKITIKSEKICISKHIYVNSYNSIFIFIFDNINFHSVNFKLTDKNYIGLPIMKGELILCQKST